MWAMEFFKTDLDDDVFEIRFSRYTKLGGF